MNRRTSEAKSKNYEDRCVLTVSPSIYTTKEDGAGPGIIIFTTNTL